MKYLITLFYFFIFLQCSAQSILIEYEEIRPENNIVNNIEVWVTDSITTNQGKSGKANNLKEAYFVKKKKQGFVYYAERFLRKHFYVKDSLHNFKWELLPDTATILKRKCMSAKTTFRGREYKVFYTPEIPISDGPWKLEGLPGLILEAKSNDGFISWRAVKIDLAYKGSFQYGNLTKNVYMDWHTYVAKHKEDVDKVVHQMRSNEQFNNSNTRFKIPSIEIFYPALQVEGILIEH